MRWTLLAWLVLLSGLTARQSAMYGSELTVWATATRYAPTFRAWLNYRSALLKAGELEQAIDTCGPLQQFAHTPRELRDTASLCLGVR